MISLLPFGIVMLLAAATLLFWAAFKTIAAYRERKPIRIIPLISLLLALAVTAFISWVVIALTIGLAHSRSPFEYTRVYGLACMGVIFILPAMLIVTYQFKIKRRNRE